MNITLRQLKVFVGVAATSSFTKTAQRLHLSQAALSAIIRELETQLRCRLLNRTTRAVSLTEAGRLFLPTATQIVEQLESSALELKKIGREEQRVLRVGVTPHIAINLMPAVLRHFSRNQPDVQVEMTDREPVELLSLVESGDLDIAFGGFFDKRSGINRVEIFPRSLVMVSSLREAGAWADFGPEVRWSMLQDVPLICYDKNNPIQRLIEEKLAQEEVTTGPRRVVGQLATAIAMAEAGFGVAILPYTPEATYQRFKVRVDVLQPVVELAFYSITQAGRGDLGILAEFVDALRDVAQVFHDRASAQQARKTRRKQQPGLA